MRKLCFFEDISYHAKSEGWSFKIGQVIHILSFHHHYHHDHDNHSHHHPVGIFYIYSHAKSGDCSFKIGRVMAIFSNPEELCIVVYGNAFHSKIKYALGNAYNKHNFVTGNQ